LLRYFVAKLFDFPGAQNSKQTKEKKQLRVCLDSLGLYSATSRVEASENEAFIYDCNFFR